MKLTICWIERDHKIRDSEEREFSLEFTEGRFFEIAQWMFHKPENFLGEYQEVSFWIGSKDDYEAFKGRQTIPRSVIKQLLHWYIDERYYYDQDSGSD